MARRDEIRKRLDQLVEGFDFYLRAFDELQPFGGPDAHVAPLQRLAKLGSPSQAVQDPDFQRTLWKTLHRFGLNARGSELAADIRSRMQLAISLGPP
jgi:hypothetical protein